MKRAQLVRQILNVVVEEEQVLEVCAHTQLSGECGDLVERGVEEAELAQLANSFRQPRQLVRGNVQVIEELVSEEFRREVAKALAAHVHVEPVLPRRVLFQRRASPTFRHVAFTICQHSPVGCDRAADASILGGLKSSVVVRLLLVRHGRVGSLGLLVQAELLLPHLVVRARVS